MQVEENIYLGLKRKKAARISLLDDYYLLLIVPKKLFMIGSVEAPWERAVALNKVPYYIK